MDSQLDNTTFSSKTLNISLCDASLPSGDLREVAKVRKPSRDHESALHVTPKKGRHSFPCFQNGGAMNCSNEEQRLSLFDRSSTSC
ncbi:hypothetical protein E2C01_018996 [Portunus trituberculatus]|uniref:Uncharacterized protein n=1 Tax=Portunus trituberculatus TaxID=210409 RepID=A0A5B7DY25_PORTR|nr:hypothetical protein [Portunus trituberculatus]